MIPLRAGAKGEKAWEEVMPAEGIRVGDCIRYPADGLDCRGKVVRVDGETYTVTCEDWNPADLATRAETP